MTTSDFISLSLREVSVKSGESHPHDLASSCPRPAELFEEITGLSAESLFQDFQAHRKVTVQSPQVYNHRITLTTAAKENK